MLLIQCSVRTTAALQCRKWTNQCISSVLSSENCCFVEVNIRGDALGCCELWFVQVGDKKTCQDCAAEPFTNISRSNMNTSLAAAKMSWASVVSFTCSKYPSVPYLNPNSLRWKVLTVGLTIHQPVSSKHPEYS